MIEVKHLRLIDTVSKVGSLNKAADELCLTQSALSHQLKELELKLGVEIFYRNKNQLLFTKEGKELRDAGAGILDQLKGLEKKVKEISQSQLKKYVHGYSEFESRRLNNQAKTMSDLLHYDSVWDENSTVLEVGCGIGAQTSIISVKNLATNFTSIDLSESSLTKAKETIDALGVENVTFRHADVYDLPFDTGSFDHIFVCFVLEHLADPTKALLEIKRVLKKGGTLMVIEGDHDSTYFYPETKAAKKAIQAQVDLQSKNGGNANIGRQLFPLLKDVGFSNVHVDPRQVYVDQSRPEMVEGFIKNTFTAMIEGVKEEAVNAKIISSLEMEEGINDLLKTADGGTFCYTFFKAKAFK
ncbi:methyltransferase domain-containing protein [Reichenbachiella versicolor]|uniref:methyltransferase domain-containing protein n=1 Tax=Reichenbachiella versicolor TaxID=1821036 RepID=UPI000D6E31A1|nr:methyltransferase domain-containing protein [Reichenbachiella versicolor]